MNECYFINSGSGDQVLFAGVRLLLQPCPTVEFVSDKTSDGTSLALQQRLVTPYALRSTYCVPTMDEFFVITEPIPTSASDDHPDDVALDCPSDAERYGSGQSTFYCVIA